jgi:protoporphyrinogen oxidase
MPLQPRTPSPPGTADEHRVVIVGAGPAGLTAAYQLGKAGVPSVVLEKDETVGGLSRTARHGGYHFDIGGHRFFTKVKAVDDFWHEVLPAEDFLTRGRMSRIYYNKKFFDYPLRAANALFGLGPWTSFMVLLSYLKSRLFPVKDERSFADWVSNRFGMRLYRIFFETYTEKVWGIPCSELSAEWAAQRIKGLSLLTAVKNALLPQRPTGDKSAVIKTLIDSFEYPRRGPGMMWETVAERIQAAGSEVKTGADAVRVLHENGRVTAIEVAGNGRTERVTGSHFISTMPVRELVHKLDPPPPPEILAAADKLNYRDFLTVALIVDNPDLFPDNWIYIHDPDVKVGRVQNFKNWSPEMVPDPRKSCVGLEYFCFEGDGLWTMPDDELVKLGAREMEQLGLLRAADVEDGAVVRMAKAYPVYDGVYAGALAQIRSWLEGLPNLQLVGRNGMHKYNNQDHSMLTAMLAAENILGAKHDVWSVNVDQEYQEEITREEAERRAIEAKALEATQPRVPVPLGAPVADPLREVIRYAFARLHKAALGTALGTVGALYVLATTAWVLWRGGPTLEMYLGLLSQYLIGYSVSWTGALIGAGYGFAWGFALGWLIAYLRNLSLGIYVAWIHRRAEAARLGNFFDYI